ncbi:MAG: AAA family ATPase [Candidatus Woesearchaeota archaeon]
MWYEKLGFRENPFTTNPKKNHDKLVRMDEIIDEMFYRIESGSMLVIEGPQGSCKTTLMMIAAKKFGGNKNVAYVDCKILDKNLNITHVLQDKYGFLGRILNKKPKEMILLLDNVQELSKKNTERIKYYFDQNNIKSIIFTTEKYSKAKFSESLRDRIGKRVLKIPELDEFDAIEIVKKRIGENSDLFNEELIKKLFKLSNNSPKLFLENCEKVAEAAVKKGRKRVQLVDFKVLSTSQENVSDKKSQDKDIKVSDKNEEVSVEEN